MAGYGRSRGRGTRLRLPGPVQILQAIPAGSRRLRGRRIERDYLTQLATDERLAALRADARDNTIAVAKQLARHASYEDGTSRPTRARICKLTGICISAWKAARRRLEDWGFLGTVVEGTTPEFRPMALGRDEPNTAAVYVICVPRRRPVSPAGLLTRPPTASARTLVQRPAREGQSQTRIGPASGRAQPGAAARGAAAPAARVMRKAAGQPITEGWSAWIWRPFAAAGWTAKDLTWAIDHPPGDRGQHRLSAGIRHPVGWLRHRLGLWLGDDGTPLPSLSQVRAAARERAAAEARKFRELTAELAGGLAGELVLPPGSVPPPAGPPADPAPHAAAIRERLGWRISHSADKGKRRQDG